MEYLEDEFFCSRCGGEFDEDEITHFDNEVFCDECLDRCTGVCDDSGERVLHSDIHSDSTYTLIYS